MKNASFCMFAKNYVEVQIMHIADYFNYYKNNELKFSAVEKPYQVYRTLIFGNESAISTIFFLAVMLGFVQEDRYLMVVVLLDTISGLKA
jgi:hypothetical protein